MGILDIESAREYVRDYSVPIDSLYGNEVCVDERNPEVLAMVLARGGATIGRGVDFIDSAEEVGIITSFPPELILGRMLTIARRHDLLVTGHTDRHSLEAKPLMSNPATDPIGCGYVGTAARRSPFVRRFLAASRTLPSIPFLILDGAHDANAVIVDEEEEDSFPHRKNGIAVFKWNIKRDQSRTNLYLAELEIDQLNPDLVNRVAQDNMNKTLANIPTAQGLPIFRSFRYNGVREVEQVGIVGQ